jgi:hypothetical protein
MQDAPDNQWTLHHGLAGYLRAVATAVGVPSEGTDFEISDTATAYLGLARRSTEWPDQDLMLVWSERRGWSVAVETDPVEAPVVLAHLDVDDVAPEPKVVAAFVVDVVAGRYSAAQDTVPVTPTRQDLARMLKRYAGAT